MTTNVIYAWDLLAYKALGVPFVEISIKYTIYSPRWICRPHIIKPCIFKIFNKIRFFLCTNGIRWGYGVLWWHLLWISPQPQSTTKKSHFLILYKKRSQKYIFCPSPTFCIILQKTGGYGYLDVYGVLDASRHQRYRKKNFKIFSVGSVH